MSEEGNGTVIPITDATPLTALQGGRPIKFTPERMEQIKNLVERGMSREEIAETIGVTLGSLQVTCSKHGISLRRPRPPIADRIGRSGPRQPPSTAAPVRAVLHAGRRQIDLPLPDDMIGQLAIEAHFANMRISDLVVQLIAKALKDPEIVS
jgi:hypothetical protein